MKRLKSEFEQTFLIKDLMIGKVVDIDDPKKRNRVRVRILGLIDDETPDLECPWAEQGTPIFNGTKETSGISSVPRLGSFVYIQFLYGDPSKPVYLGYVRGDQDSSELQKNDDLTNTIHELRKSNQIGPELSPLNDKSVYPYNNVIETESDNIIELDDTKGNERIAIEHGKTGSFIEIRPDGTVQLKSIKDLYVIVKQMVEEYIEGNVNIKIKGNNTESIDGSVSITIGGDETKSVGGNESKSISGTFTLNASNIYLN